jgi:hypothetical protein
MSEVTLYKGYLVSHERGNPVRGLPQGLPCTALGYRVQGYLANNASRSGCTSSAGRDPSACPGDTLALTLPTGAPHS